MTIKEEAERILKSRKIWGDIWDEYDPRTLIDIIIGKTQRTWNLLERLELTRASISAERDSKLLQESINKTKEELIDIYNYAKKLKQRLSENPKDLISRCNKCGEEFFNAFEPLKGFHHLCRKEI